MNVGILIFDEVELLDMAGPYEVFTTAARVHGRSQPAGTPPLFNVFTLARSAAPVQARAGLRLQPDCTLDDHPPLDCAIVPGGVVDAELGQAALMDWIAAQAGSARLLASVCTGALLLAQAGVLDGRTWRHCVRCGPACACWRAGAGSMPGASSARRASRPAST